MASEGDRRRDQGGSDPQATSSEDATTQTCRHSSSPDGMDPARRLVQADGVSDVVDAIVRIATETLGLPHTGVWLYESSDATLCPRSFPATDRLPEKPPVFEESD